MRNAYGCFWIAAVILCAVSAQAEQSTDPLIRVNSASGFEQYWIVSEIRRGIDHVMEFDPTIPNARQYAPIFQSQYRGYKWVNEGGGTPGVLGTLKSYLEDVFVGIPGATMKQIIERTLERERQRMLKEMQKMQDGVQN